MDKYLKIILSFITILLIFSGCPQSTSSSRKTTNSSIAIEITDLDWKIENIHPSFWSGNTDSTCFYNFWISYKGDKIEKSDIAYARIHYSSDKYWTINPEYLNTEDKKIGGYGRWFLKSDGDILPIGELKAVIKLNNNNKTKYRKNITDPGDTANSGKTYVYTEDYTGSTGNYITMIKRAEIVDENKDDANKKITIDFKVTDSRIYDGYIAFYNNDTNIGSSKKNFRDDSSGNLNAIINTGSNFHVDGTTNTVTLENDDISFKNNSSFANINKYIVVLTDGQQYSSSNPGDYDCISRSEKTDF